MAQHNESNIPPMTGVKETRQERKNTTIIIWGLAVVAIVALGYAWYDSRNTEVAALHEDSTATSMPATDNPVAGGTTSETSPASASTTPGAMSPSEGSSATSPAASDANSGVTGSTAPATSGTGGDMSGAGTTTTSTPDAATPTPAPAPATGSSDTTANPAGAR